MRLASQMSLVSRLGVYGGRPECVCVPESTRRGSKRESDLFMND